VCTLAIYWRVWRDFPLVIAANRDEFLARPTAEPDVICHDPWVVAGQDLNAGGTWLGVNEHRLVVGLLNRPGPGGPDPTRRSRGLLCLEALQSASPQEVVDRALAEEATAYNGFNLLAANANGAFVVSNDGVRIKSVHLTEEVHVLTNMDVDDPTCPRIAQSHQLFRSVTLPARDRDASSLLNPLRTILSNHDVTLDPRVPNRTNTLCVHRGEYGTRSSSVIVVPAGARPMRFWHAAGPPCRTEYAEVSLPSQRIDNSR
jgi:uncharacterized protein with NRDE domain